MLALFSVATVRSMLYHFFHMALLNDFGLTLYINLRLRLSSVTLAASFSVHLASSAITPIGSVHKSRGDNVVRMWVQLKRCD